MNFINMTIFHFYRNTAWCDNIYYISNLHPHPPSICLSEENVVSLSYWASWHVKEKMSKILLAVPPLQWLAGLPHPMCSGQPEVSLGSKLAGLPFHIHGDGKLIFWGLQLWPLPCPEINVPGPIPIKEHQIEHEAALGFKPPRAMHFQQMLNSAERKK